VVEVSYLGRYQRANLNINLSVTHPVKSMTKCIIAKIFHAELSQILLVIDSIIDSVGGVVKKGICTGKDLQGMFLYSYNLVRSSFPLSGTLHLWYNERNVVLVNLKSLLYIDVLYPVSNYIGALYGCGILFYPFVPCIHQHF